MKKNWLLTALLFCGLLCFAKTAWGAPAIGEEGGERYVQILAAEGDSAAELISGLELARYNGIKKVKLGPGNFFLKTARSVMTKAGGRQVQIPIINSNGAYDDFVIEGSTDENGVPTTKLIGTNSPQNPTNALGDLMWVQDCRNLTVKNLIFDRDPKYTVAGKIIEAQTSSTQASQNYIRVQYYDDERNVPFDGMQFACANLFDLSACPNQGEDGPEVDLSNAVLVDRSLTFGTSTGNVVIEDREKRILKITYTGSALSSDTENFARRCKVGQGISWAYSANGNLQVDFYMCDDLRLENLITYSASSMALQTHTCRNVYGNKVQFYPEPGSKQFMVCGRDAWKVFKCGGVIENRNGRQEGVRMDGQNIHGIWLLNYQKVDEYTLDFLVHTGNGSGFYLDQEDRILFHNGKSQEGLPVQSVAQQPLPDFMAANSDQGGSYYLWRVTFQSKLPDFIETIPVWNSSNGQTIKYNQAQRYTMNMFSEVEAWGPESVVIDHTSFKNIAGFGPIVKCDNTQITNCSFENMQNGAVFIGSEFPESGFPRNVTLKGNYFNNCGWASRENYYYNNGNPKTGAAIVLTSMTGYLSDPVFQNGGLVQDIRIEENVFENNFTAVRAVGVEGLTVQNNSVLSYRTNLYKDGYSACLSDNQEITEHGIVVDPFCTRVTVSGNRQAPFIKQLTVNETAVSAVFQASADSPGTAEVFVCSYVKGRLLEVQRHTVSLAGNQEVRKDYTLTSDGFDKAAVYLWKTGEDGIPLCRQAVAVMPE